ncbi:hypothetical protein LCGC14_2492650, partial [marine sediment metagenome]
IDNIGEEYIEDLEATYTGEFALQELEGQFVDIIEGRVYPQFERKYHVDWWKEEIVFEDHLPLYGFWDYGIGDEGALWVAQTVHVPEHASIPIPDPNNEGEMMAVISMVGPSNRIKMDTLGHFAGVVRGLTDEASRALGYHSAQKGK